MKLALLHFSVRKIFSHQDPGRQTLCRDHGTRTVFRERAELSEGAQERESTMLFVVWHISDCHLE